MAEHVQRLFAATDAEKVIEQVLCSRRLRSSLFGSKLFSDPAWDIVLTLYLAELRHEPISTPQLAEAIDLPAATARRWLAALANDGLLRQGPKGADADRAGVELSDAGSSAIRRWLGLWLNCSCEAATDSRVTNLLSRMAGDEFSRRQ
jgi:DNA-binding MarR family transcriptional regulator